MSKSPGHREHRGNEDQAAAQRIRDAAGSEGADDPRDPVGPEEKPDPARRQRPVRPVGRQEREDGAEPVHVDESRGVREGGIHARDRAGVRV